MAVVRYSLIEQIMVCDRPSADKSNADRRANLPGSQGQIANSGTGRLRNGIRNYRRRRLRPANQFYSLAS